jgi:hypothetical protein
MTKRVRVAVLAILAAGCFGKPLKATVLDEALPTVGTAAPEAHDAPAPLARPSATWATLTPATQAAPEPEKPAEVAAEELWHSRQTLGQAWQTRYPAGERLRITGIIAQPSVGRTPSGQREYRVSFYTFIARPDDERLPATLEHLSKLPPRFKSTTYVHCVFEKPDDLVGLDGLDPATIEGRLTGYRDQPVAGLVFTDCKVIRRPLK